MIKRIILIIAVLFSVYPPTLKANICDQLLPNSGTEIYTSDSVKCTNIKFINISNTVIVADPSFLENASYKVTVKSPSGTVLLNQAIDKFSAPLIQKINTHGHDEIEVVLEPLTPDINYNFAIAHDENTETNKTIIYIGLNSSKKASTSPPPPDDPRCNPQCEIPLMAQLVDTSVFYSTNNVRVASEISQCNDENRPPEPAPINNAAQQLDVNEVLRESTAWNTKLLSEGLTEVENNIIRFLRIRAMHRVGGSLDLAHSSPTNGYDGSATMGNFLYGANASALGMPP